MAKQLICLFAFVTCSQFLFGQINTLENEEVTKSSTMLVEILENLRQHPLNLNALTEEALSVLPCYNDSLMDRISQHIAKHGDFVDILELQQCRLTQQEIFELRQFVTVRQTGDANDIERYKHTIVATVLSPISGSQTTNSTKNHLGTPTTTVLRYRGVLNRHFRIGFIGEKDAGESLFNTHSASPFDFNSGYVQVSLARNKQIIVGDYTCDFGQGLTVGNGMRVGKSALALRTSKLYYGLKPYRSVTEFGFNRGVAIQIQKPIGQWTIWLHQKREDASISLVNNERQFSSFQHTGFHRTKNELENKNTIRSRQVGINHTRNFKRLQIAYTGLIATHNAIKMKTSRLYQKFNYTGKRYVKQGFSYRFKLNTGYLFGESTWSSNNKMAHVHGGVVGLGKIMSITSLYRYYAPGFIGIGSRSFAESSRLANESGIYFGMEVKPKYKVQITGYVDHYWFPWLTSATNTGSRGVDYLCRVTYKPSKQLQWHAQLKHEVRSNHADLGGQFHQLKQVGTTKFRIHLTQVISKQLRFQTRLAYNQSVRHDTVYKGVMLYQDVQYKLPFGKATFYLRFASASIDDYSARIYTYENDLTYRFSLPAYTGDQLRSYFLLRWKMMQHMDFWVKYILTNKSTGSELYSVSSPHDSKVHLQLRIKL